MSKPTTPARSPDEPLVAIVDLSASEVGQYVKDCERRSGEDGILRDVPNAFTRVRTRRGLKQPTLDPNDAYRLYDQLHFSRALVLVFTAFVSRTPLSARRRRSSARLRTPQVDFSPIQQARWATALRVSPIGVLGVIRREDLPRARRLHVFATSCNCLHLGTTAADDAFRRRHGSPARRRDDKDLDWIRADRSAYHGRPVLRIAGRELHRGMHWDVSSRRQRKVQNSIEVWRLTGSRNSYANVYPNAHIQVPVSKSTARKGLALRGSLQGKMPRISGHFHRRATIAKRGLHDGQRIANRKPMAFGSPSIFMRRLGRR